MAGYVDAHQTADPARLYFTPRRPPGGTQNGTADWIEGRVLLDWRQLPVLDNAPKPAQAAQAPQGEVRATPVDLGAVRERLGAIRRPDWAVSLGRVITGKPPSPAAVGRPVSERPGASPGAT